VHAEVAAIEVGAQVAYRNPNVVYISIYHPQLRPKGPRYMYVSPVIADNLSTSSFHQVLNSFSQLLFTKFRFP
jgi:hypothetical protein